MLINPNYAIEQGWITGLKDRDLQVQPNAIDFTLDNVFVIDHASLCTISEVKSERQMRASSPLPPANLSDDGREWYTLAPNMVYDCLSDVYVNVPDDVACKLIIRSTFNRNGFFLTSGLYDTGYEGHVGFALHNRSGLANVQRGVRVGQIEFYASDSNGKYAGGWNHKQNTHWNENTDVMQELNG